MWSTIHVTCIVMFLCAAPTDYSLVSKDLTFTSNVNNSAITVDIPIIYYPTEERSETFFVSLSATDPSIHLSISQAVVTILDTNGRARTGQTVLV